MGPHGHTGASGLSAAKQRVLSAGSWEDFDAAVDKAVPFCMELPIDKELGAIPETVRLRHPHLRGRHPLFAFLAVGSRAAEVVAAERPDWPLGPIELLPAWTGLSFCSVSATRSTPRSTWPSNTSVAHGSSDTPRLPPGAYGPSSQTFLDRATASMTSSRLFVPPTRAAVIGDCRVRVVPLRDVLRAATEAIVSDAGALLCDDNECRCGAARRQRESFVDR